MKTFIIISGLLGLAGTIFGYWGMCTEAGSKKFDEMAGMIPLGALCLGGFLLVISVACLAYALIKGN